MKRIATRSGSVYLVREGEGGALLIKQERGVKVEGLRYTGDEYDDWQPCEAVPWPPEVGKSLWFERPNVPFGKGQLTVTTPVEKVEEV